MKKLLLGDSLEMMRTLPDGSVDMVLCDLPYGTTACSWDSIIPWEPLWAEYYRLCKKNAAMVFTGSQPFTTTLISSNIKDFRYCWVWEKEKGVNFLNVNKMPYKVHEDVAVFYREFPTYNPQMWKSTPYKTAARGTSGDVTGNVKKIAKDNSEGTRYPRSIIQVDTEKGYHPTQKPVELMKYFILTYTNPGETVLDNTMGSGTTGVACIETGRNFFGIERDEKHFKTANYRTSDVTPEMAMF